MSSSHDRKAVEDMTPRERLIAYLESEVRSLDTMITQVDEVFNQVSETRIEYRLMQSALSAHLKQLRTETN